MERVVAPDPLAAAHATAQRMAAAIDAARAAGRDPHVALAGGTTPRAAYAALATRVARWDDVHLWLGDERMVPPDSPDANVEPVRSLLPVGPGGARLHPVPTDLPADAAADAYGAQIAGALPSGAQGLPVFDIVLLGLGEDCHVASLFPGSDGLAARTVCIAVHDAPKPPPERVSLTLATINAARRRLVLAVGTGKAAAVAAASGTPSPAAPGSLVRRDATAWILDVAAATPP